jgi:hypothetical protein
MIAEVKPENFIKTLKKKKNLCCPFRQGYPDFKSRSSTSHTHGRQRFI